MGAGTCSGSASASDRDLWPDSLLGVAAEQGFFTPIFASYMLNVEGVRVAPTLNGNSVIRIEPPLTFRRSDCEELLEALERALEAFSQRRDRANPEGDPGGRPSDPPPPRGAPKPRPSIVPVPGETRFAFLLHPLDDDRELCDFDPSLAVLGRRDLARVARDLSDLIDPFVFSRVRVTSKTGRTIYGEFIALPWTAAAGGRDAATRRPSPRSAGARAGAIARCSARRTGGLHVGGHARRPRRLRARVSRSRPAIPIRSSPRRRRSTWP